MIACGVVIPVGGQTVESEMRQLVRQLDLFVSETIITDQSTQLGPEFRQTFRTRPQLNLANVGQYFATHPSEVMAFRRYIQQLANTGFISGDLAESLVIAAFQSLELAPKNQALARSSILDSASSPSTSNTVEVFDLKLEGTNHRIAFRRKTPSQATNRWILGNLWTWSKERRSPPRSLRTSWKNRSASSEQDARQGTDR